MMTLSAAFSILNILERPHTNRKEEKKGKMGRGGGQRRNDTKSSGNLYPAVQCCCSFRDRWRVGPGVM